jgi:hypothetical protein
MSHFLIIHVHLFTLSRGNVERRAAPRKQKGSSSASSTFAASASSALPHSVDEQCDYVIGFSSSSASSSSDFQPVVLPSSSSVLSPLNFLQLNTSSSSSPSPLAVAAAKVSLLSKKQIKRL